MFAVLKQKTYEIDLFFCWLVDTRFRRYYIAGDFAFGCLYMVFYTVLLYFYAADNNVAWVALNYTCVASYVLYWGTGRLLTLDTSNGALPLYYRRDSTLGHFHINRLYFWISFFCVMPAATYDLNMSVMPAPLKIAYLLFQLCYFASRFVLFFFIWTTKRAVERAAAQAAQPALETIE